MAATCFLPKAMLCLALLLSCHSPKLPNITVVDLTTIASSNFHQKMTFHPAIFGVPSIRPSVSHLCSTGFSHSRIPLMKWSKHGYISLCVPGHDPPVMKKSLQEMSYHICPPGNNSDICNYHPISICSAVGKVLERMVANRLSDHLFTFKLLSDAQHGFLPGRSCTTQVSRLFHDWSAALDKRQPPRVDAIFLDWARAFDKVPHNRLISKLHNYGICGSLHNWFHSLRSFRKPRVILQDSVLDWFEVSSGVPQGSILAPLLFNIFVNHLPGIISSSVAQYADDTIIYRITTALRIPSLSKKI